MEANKILRSRILRRVLLFPSYAGDPVAWLENLDGKGDFRNQKRVSDQSDAAKTGVAADLDRAGDIVVVSTSSALGKIAYYENTNRGFLFGDQQFIGFEPQGTIAVVVADIDGDGDQDVMSASGSDLSRYENPRTGTFVPQRVIIRRNMLPQYRQQT